MSEAPWAHLPAPIGDEGPEDEYVLAVEGLHKRFGDGPEIYHDLHLRIRRGEIVIIVGESGIGKSVFLKHLIGLEEPTSGGIWYRPAGKAARDRPVHLLAESEMSDIRREISMVFQASSLFDWMTVYENIALPLEEHRERVRERLATYLDDPAELTVILRRAKGVPGAFAGLARETAAPRDALKAQLTALTAALAKGDADLERALVNALGADAAEDLTAARAGADAASTWKDTKGILAAWSTETLGDLLASVDPGELAPEVARFRSDYVAARRALRQAWSSVRGSWRSDFSDLGSLLAPSVEEWAKQEGMALPAGAASGADRLRAALSLLKVRPSLLAAALTRAGSAAPAVFGPLVPALAEFAGRLRALEAALLAHVAAPAGEADLRRAILLSWLAARPMAVDRAAVSAHLLAAIVESFEHRPEELGQILSRRAAVTHAPALASFTQAHEAYRQAFAHAFRSVLPGDEEARIDAFTELVVNGLMASVKLNVQGDREKLPSELSGGMRTRVGLARSLATLPSVVLYDEPTAGLDPVLSQDIAREILELQTSGVVSTSIVVTHDKDLYSTLKLAGRTRMLYLSGGRFLDLEARPVRDPLRLGEQVPKPEPVREPGERGYAPARFISEFEPEKGRGHSPEV